METLIVIVIMGILSTLAMSHYQGIYEQQLDREAEGNLRIITSAQRAFQIDNQGLYYPPSLLPANDNNIARINTNLMITVPTRNWTYQVFSFNNRNPRAFCTRAQRNGADNRIWRLNMNDVAMVANGQCL